jgi:hypothetical protein
MADTDMTALSFLKPNKPATILPLDKGYVTTTVLEKVVIAAGGTATLIDQAFTSPGYCSKIWFTFTGVTGAAKNDPILNIYVDGESSPSITTDLGHLLGHWTVTGLYQTANIRSEQDTTNTNGTYTIDFPIPFSSHLKITIVTSDGFPNLFSIIYVNQGGEVLPYRLKSSSRTMLNRLTGITPTNMANGTLEFLNLASGEGWIVWHCLYYTDLVSSNWSSMENNIVVYRDGLAPGAGVFPQFDTSGGEDYFGSSWYFQGTNIPGLSATQQNLDHVLLAKNSTVIGMAVDLMSMHGGLHFKNGVKLRAEKGLRGTAVAQTGNCSASWLVLYYVPFVQ